MLKFTHHSIGWNKTTQTCSYGWPYWQPRQDNSRCAAQPAGNKADGTMKLLTHKPLDTRAANTRSPTDRHAVFDDEFHQVFFDGGEEVFTRMVHQRTTSSRILATLQITIKSLWVCSNTISTSTFTLWPLDGSTRPIIAIHSQIAYSRYTLWSGMAA